MSITWEEPGAGGALSKTATQVAALVLLAIVGGAGGAAIAAHTLRGGIEQPAAVMDDPAPSPSPAGTGTEAPDAVAKPRAETAPAPAKPAPAADLFGPPQLAALSLPGVAALPAADPARRAERAALAETPVAETPAEETRMEETQVAETRTDEVPLAGIDAGETASILSPDEPVAVAETEAEIAALEAQMAAEGAQAFDLPADPAADEPTEVAAVVPAERPDAPLAPDGTPLTPARTAQYVNLRAGPDNDAEVLTIVPARADILAEENCLHWCAVVHDGRQGFIYKSFIARES